ncbi:uncharacterized protein QC761_0027280 [Podospora bellae-mahoneyi]|uniref:Major facilitator superfamily (MFS) profile domain-containing protein n=1 Tax=Podospora bellae-mahoneyi TaxID=2093777 RepID=A0ABR0FTK2_9PEZI|nr:hypothetical protein QC761_0027280 [Podospora bellae-mahoneyi]
MSSQERPPHREVCLYRKNPWESDKDSESSESLSSSDDSSDDETTNPFDLFLPGSRPQQPPFRIPRPHYASTPSSSTTISSASSSFPFQPKTTESTPLLPSSAPSKSPYLSGLSRPRFWLLFGQIILSQLIICFDGTIMASSHPVITSHFRSANSASWLSTSFLLTQTSFQPLVGGLSDAIGRKTPYLILAAVFSLGTLWCAVAESMLQFILARAVCGLGAGGMMTLGSIIMSDVVPIEIRPRYQSLLNVTFGVGSMMGAGLGGLMADCLGWRWEFGVQVPVLIICVGVSGLVIPGDLGLYGKQKVTIQQALREFDFWGAATLAGSVTGLVLGVGLGGNVLPWSHPVVVGSLMCFAVVFPVFLWVEGWVRNPIMPLHLVFKAPHMNLMVSSHISALLAAAILFNVPLFFQGVLLTSATESGLRLVTCSAVQALCGMTAGFLITWSRRMKWPLITGATLVIAGLFCLFSMERGWPTWVYMLCLVPASAGQGFQFPGSFMAVLAASKQHEQAVVTSTLMLWRSTGNILGVACSSLVVQNSLWYHLQEFVSGPEKEAVISKVRKSVEAIRDLEGTYQDQVVQSYAAALRLTFLCCFALAVANLCLVAPVRLGRLGSKK